MLNPAAAMCNCTRVEEKISSVELFFIELILKEQMKNFGYVLEARVLNQKEWSELFEILNDPLIKSRFTHWLQTAQGVEAFPSDPVQWAKREMAKL